MVSVHKRFDDFMLDARQLQPLGIIVNELLTNTMKYALVGRTHGAVTASALLADAIVMVSIADDGFGLELVHGLMQQLRGTMRMESCAGTRVELEFHPNWS